MTEEKRNSGEQKLSPQTILDMNYAYARTAMLAASVRLHLFTLLAGKTRTPAELAREAHTLPEPTARLLKGLEALDLVEQAGDAYRLTPLAEQFLVEGKPSYLGGDTLGVLDFLPAWFTLADVLRTSTPYRDLGDPTTAEAFFAPRVVDMFPAIFPVASRLAATLPLPQPQEMGLQVLDVAAGSSPWGAAFALQYPAAQVTALDLPAVVTQGRQHTASLGLAERFTWLEANIETFEFQAYRYDLICCGHLLRFISDERAQTLLARLARSLRQQGTLLIADIFLNDERSGPPSALTIDLSMLVNTAQGRIRTPGEIIAWLRDFGLHHIERIHLAGPFPVVVARKGESL